MWERRQDFRQDNLRIDFCEIDSSSIKLQYVSKTFLVEIQKALGFVSGLRSRPQSESVRAYRRKKYGPEAEPYIFVDNFDRMSSESRVVVIRC